jgi:hypothetical protein
MLQPNTYAACSIRTRFTAYIQHTCQPTCMLHTACSAYTIYTLHTGHAYVVLTLDTYTHQSNLLSPQPNIPIPSKKQKNACHPYISTKPCRDVGTYKPTVIHAYACTYKPVHNITLHACPYRLLVSLTASCTLMATDSSTPKTKAPNGNQPTG